MTLGQSLLAKHLVAKGSAAELARKLGVARSLVSQWKSGARIPGRKNARRLEEISGGAVPSESWDQPAAGGASRTRRRRPRPGGRQRERAPEPDQIHP